MRIDGESQITFMWYQYPLYERPLFEGISRSVTARRVSERSTSLIIVGAALSRTPGGALVSGASMFVTRVDCNSWQIRATNVVTLAFQLPFQ